MDRGAWKTVVHRFAKESDTTCDSTTILFSVVTVPIYIPTSSEGSLLSVASPAVIVCGFFDDGQL